VEAGKRTFKAWIRVGDHLLMVAAGLLGALGDVDEFPQDRAGIETLVGEAPPGPDGERLLATYEDPDAPLTYLGGHGTWVAPAGEGRLRIRQRAFATEELASQVWILGPDGSLGDPETIEGYGVPEDELPPQVLAEIEETERRRREAEARRPEAERRSEEHQNRHRLEHLLGVTPGPTDQDPSGPIVTHVVLYDTGALVHYLLPRPDETGFEPEEPWERPEVEPPRMTLDDGLGTEFASSSGQVDHSGEGPLRCRQEFSPAVAADATGLVVGLDETRVAIELGQR
jgi:hypothetical protein